MEILACGRQQICRMTTNQTPTTQELYETDILEQIIVTSLENGMQTNRCSLGGNQRAKLEVPAGYLTTPKAFVEN